MNPLVSVIVISYNSEEFILETLESIKNQTYPNIELIISDDNSTDNTAQLAKKWLTNNGRCFINSQLIVNDKNSGVSSNCNLGVGVSSGKWIKLIAADDILLPNCIEENVMFSQKNPEACIIVSKIRPFIKNRISDEMIFSEMSADSQIWFDYDLSLQDQINILLRKNDIPAPASFILTSFLQQVGGFDETFKMIDDWPLWIKSVLSKRKIFSLNKETVLYRQHGKSLSNSGSSVLFSSIAKDELRIFKLCRQKYLPFWERIFLSYHLHLKVAFLNINLNKKKYFLLYKILVFPSSLYYRYSNRRIESTINRKYKKSITTG